MTHDQHGERSTLAKNDVTPRKTFADRRLMVGEHNLYVTRIGACLTFFEFETLKGRKPSDRSET